MSDTRESDLIESIYDALDRGDAEAALDIALRALEQEEEAEDPVLHFLAGYAFLELDQPQEAADELTRAAELDPDDAESRAILARSLFRSCRFEEAEAAASKALELDPKQPDAHDVMAVLQERRGKFDEADKLFTRAAKLDPDRYPKTERLDRAAFETEVVRAGELLPEEFRKRLDEVAVSVEDVPSDEIVFGEQPPLDPELLGLFVGVSLADRSHLGPGGELPPRILLFQRNLERYAGDGDTLRKEIAVTLYHELGHYLGFDEDELGELDLA
jgi:predicted Zn-dependent protease with MMP-like domain